MLTGDAPIVISSQLLNRQDGEDEYHAPGPGDGRGGRPPQGRRRSTGGCCCPDSHSARRRPDDAGLPVRQLGDDRRGRWPTTRLATPRPVRGGHPRRRRPRQGGLPGRGPRGPHAARSRSSWPTTPRAACPCASSPTAATAPSTAPARHAVASTTTVEQREWYDDFWAASDVEIDPATPTDPRSSRRCASTCSRSPRPAPAPTSRACPAKGVTGSGYEGHYFWDTEVYVAPVPHLHPARVLPGTCCTSAAGCCPPPATRAREMSMRGALFPWRTINGEEASAYYAAGTAQVHIDADIAYALLAVRRRHRRRRVPACVTASAVLVETARMYADLGFWRSNGTPSFHIHGVTGPDEYTTVVNNNLFTNVMARLNLEQAVAAVARVRSEHPEEWARIAARLSVRDDEVAEWRGCAAGMHIPFDEGLGIHPQDDFFLDREVWDLSRTPARARPLLLHYHPLVIYRFQVLKQADVVLAMFLAGRPLHRRRRSAPNFEYYDPITTGDSTPLGRRAVGGRRRGRVPRGRPPVLPRGPLRRPREPARATPSTGCTSPRPAGSGPPWSTGSAGCATTAGCCGSTRGCPTGGRP